MSFLSRREFLKDSALFAAAAAALGHGPSWAEETKPAKKVGANDRVRVAVIGFNGQGRSHLSGFAGLPDSIVTVMCDADRNVPGYEQVAKTLKEVETKQGSRPEFVQDLRRVLDNKEIDAVSIATPNHWHALAAIWAIQAGKDVYLEKPVSHNVWEGRRIVDAARQFKRIVQTGTQSRSNEGMRQTIDYVLSGKIGKVTLARGLCYKDRKTIGPKAETKVPEGVDYYLWLGPAPEKPVTRAKFHYDWHWFWDYGNGDLGNQGIHEMDKARWGLNKPALPKAVQSLGGRFGYDDAGETANTQICCFDYGDCQLIFEVRGLPTKDLLGAKVGNIWYGSDGYVVSTNYQSGAAFTPKGELVKKFEGGGNHYANFLKAVKSRKHTDLAADIEEGHISSALCHLGNISYQLASARDSGSLRMDDKNAQEAYGRMVDHLKENNVRLEMEKAIRVGPVLEFDPKAERFTGNAEANKLLTRAYRKGFVVPEKF